MSTPPPAKRTKATVNLLDTTGTTIEVRVGALSTVLHVHQKLICNKSTFFTNLVTAGSKIVVLPDTEVDIFRTYLHWLYTGNVDNLSTEMGSSLELAKTYVLGEKMIDPDFQDAVMTKLILSSNYECPCVDAVGTIYLGTPKGSPARLLMVDFYVHRAHGGWNKLDELPRLVSAEFAGDLIAALVTKRPFPPGPWPWVPHVNSYRVKPAGIKSESSG
ncbi:hypothetical protein K491DRAFT_711585 [Lophiostoma macrostomum CBS 122681]|uniref:BTB domain-containing protein n=1 Tax=Lophiostoma macrostomum CBS 122681 TaxID=1314788 RepID=A0A6A6TKX7_9PLEO|nr:hypothetical protein K491DRAFT_711585 [Lophiostoma macrostomum CBS 122681]